MGAKKPFVVFYPKIFPAVNPQCDRRAVTRKCPWPGLFVEVDGNWDGVFECIKNGTIDTMGYGLMRTPSRLQHFNFSNVLYSSAIYAVHRKPFGAADSKYSFFEIYSPDVLYAFFVVMALQAAFYYSHYRAIAWSRPSTRGHLLFDSVWAALTLQLAQSAGQASNPTYAISFNRIMLLMLNTPVLLGQYTTWIVSHRLWAPPEEAITSYEELIDALRSRRRYLVKFDGGADWFFDEVATSKVFPFQDIRDTLNAVFADRFAHLDDGLGVALLPDDTQPFQSVLDLCNLVHLTTAIDGINRRFVWRQNRSDTLVADMNAFIEEHLPALSLVFNKYRTQLTRGKQQCRTVKPDMVQPYAGLMVVWVGLCAAALLAFLLETGFHALRRRRKRPPKPRRTAGVVFGTLGRLYTEKHGRTLNIP